MLSLKESGGSVTPLKIPGHAIPIWSNSLGCSDVLLSIPCEVIAI